LLVCWPLIRCVQKKGKTHARVRRLNIIPLKYFKVRGRGRGGGGGGAVGTEDPPLC